MNVFEKISKVKRIVADVYPEITSEELKSVTEFLANNWHGKKQRNITLTQQQFIIYELLMKHSYSPATYVESQVIDQVIFT